MFKKNKIVLIVPEESVKGTKEIISDQIIVKPLKSRSSKISNYKPSLINKIEHTLRNILAFTYGRKLNYENCISQKFQIKAFFNAQKIKSFKSIIISIFVICNAYLSSYFKFYRILLQRFLYFFLDNNDHKDLYDKFKPSLVIVGSMGLDADGLVLAESKKNKITSLVINQSWDRVVCAGISHMSS